MSTGIVIWGTFTSVANVNGKCPNGFCPKGFWTPNEGGEGGCIDPWLFSLIELVLMSKRRGERKNIRTFLSNNKLLNGTLSFQTIFSSQLALNILENMWKDFLNTLNHSKLIMKKLFPWSVQEELKNVASDPKSVAFWNPEWRHFQMPPFSDPIPSFSVPMPLSWVPDAWLLGSSWTLTGMHWCI